MTDQLPIYTNLMAVEATINAINAGTLAAQHDVAVTGGHCRYAYPRHTGIHCAIGHGVPESCRGHEDFARGDSLDPEYEAMFGMQLEDARFLSDLQRVHDRILVTSPGSTISLGPDRHNLLSSLEGHPATVDTLLAHLLLIRPAMSMAA